MSAPTARKEPMERRVIRTDTTAKMIAGPEMPFVVTLIYDPADPFAVTLEFHDSTPPVTWTFHRDLLDSGLKDHTGQGDVRIWPTDTGEVDILVESPDGRAVFEFNKKILREFVRSTYRMVPRRKELSGVDMDAVIARLLV